MTNNIKKMLRIVEEDLEILSVDQKIYKKEQTLIVSSKFSPKPKACPKCGSTVKNTEGKYIIVKNGTKESNIRLEHYNHMPTIMKLKKQRYTCRNCESHFTANPKFVKKNCWIAEHVKLKIIDLLKEKISCTLIARLCGVSITTVLRVLRSLEDYTPSMRIKAPLPKVLMVDEFRSHATYEDKMTFICADGESGQLTDILPSRQHDKLEKHFKRYSEEELNQVQFLVTDMNAAYFKLTKTCFTNAKIVIDRFHVVKHINTAFNEFRVREVKRLKKEKQKKHAQKIKSNWKLLLKNQAHIDWSDFHTWRSFRTPIYPLLTEGMVIDRLLSYSTQLEDTYYCFHSLLNAFRSKDSHLFFYHLNHLPEHIDEEFKSKVQNLLNYEEGITNALKYPYSNGKLEAKNTHIKTLKRVSYGFKSFRNMRIRIFMINNLIQIK